MCASATIANPREHAANLTGRQFTVVQADGATRAPRHVLLMNPSGSPYTAAAKLFSMPTLGLDPTVVVLLTLFVACIAFKCLLVYLANKQIGFTVVLIATDMRLTLLKSLFASSWEYFIRQPSANSRTPSPPRRTAPPPPSTRLSWNVAIAAAGLIFVSVVVYVAAMGRSAAPTVEQAEPTLSGDVSVNAAQFDDGRTRFYRYATAEGKEVRFFVLKSSDGVIRAAFDTCYVCYRERKGLPAGRRHDGLQ